MPSHPFISYYDQALKLLSNRPHAYSRMIHFIVESGS